MMSRVQIRDLAAIGEIDEIPDHSTPLNAWTTAQNVAFRDGFVQNAFGYTPVSSGDDGSNPLLARPQYLMPYLDPYDSTLHWVYGGVNDSGKGIICRYNGSTNVNITDTVNYPSTGFYGDVTRWNGAIVNGLLVINNQLTVPQMWDRTSGQLDSTVGDLTNWAAAFTGTGTCKVLRGFRSFFLAMDCSDTSGSPNRNPYEIKHSGIVDPYTAPEWLPSASNRAGAKYIGEGTGYIVDCAQMRGANIIYTTQTAYIMSFVGGNEVFAIEKTLLEYGMLTQGCVAGFKDGRHFLVSTGDIVLTDGNNAESIIDGRRRDSLFQNIDSTYYVNSFVVPNYSQGEIWFCYPKTGFTYPNSVAKWNMKTGAWSFMTLPVEVPHIAFGAVPQGVGDGFWDDDSGFWDDDTGVWNESNYNPAIRSMMMAEFGATISASALDKADDGNQQDGSNMSVVLQRTGMPVAGNGQNGPVIDPTVDKNVDEIWPLIDGGPVNIRVGTSDYLDGSITWDGQQSFDPATQRKLDVRPPEGKFIAVEFSSNANVGWSLTGYDLNIIATGDRG